MIGNDIEYRVANLQQEGIIKAPSLEALEAWIKEQNDPNLRLLGVVVDAEEYKVVSVV